MAISVVSEIYAHSFSGEPAIGWESLSKHSRSVGRRAALNAEAFGWRDVAAVAGCLHDIGKCSAAFQAYLEAADGQARGPDHSTAGAVEARRLYPGPIGRILAFVVAGHHAGLSDGIDLAGRLGKTLEPYDGWQRHVGPLPEAPALSGRLRRPSPHRGFSEAFLVRMLFSCLVDADFIETERFYLGKEGRAAEREGFTPLLDLSRRLQVFLEGLRAGADATPLNRQRGAILDHALGKAALAPGLFTMTVPTGGGKTLASLAFALDHAARHDLRRVVFVIPFTSVTEQTAGVYRTALGEVPDRPNREDVLEHHSTFDWDAAARRADDEGRGADAVDRLRRATENWAAPVVVTTGVQFFESLFANRASRCRKLHNLARSVIVLDEAQTLPLHLLRPCLAALDELARNYGASIVLCTATQPALRKQDGFDRPRDPTNPSSALDIPDERELAPDPQALYETLKRVAVERIARPVTDDEIAARFEEQPQMLCIVNTRSHAQALFARIASLPGAVHLSTLMCPAHRRAVLAEARRRLGQGLPVRIVSTSLIEAGVDIDLPEVWRAAAGLEAIAQSAGRCNREGKRPGLGRVVVFEPAAGKAPPDVERAWQACRTVLRRVADPLGLEAVRAYFGDLYWQSGSDALDAATLDGERYPILENIADRAPQRREADPALAFPFASIARAFRMIDDVMEPVIVPWSSGPEDHEAAAILGRIAALDRPLGPDLRKLQQYIVSIPKKQRQDWLALGVLRPVHRSLGDALLRFEGLEHYDAGTGVKLNAPLERSAESNLF